MNFVDLNNNKLYRGACSIIEHSKWESFSTNTRIDKFQKLNHLIHFKVGLLEDAYMLIQKFINDYRINSSNWFGDFALDSKMKVDDHVSYNGKGRALDQENWRIVKEIELC
ncbi:MAG: hypothetical protein JJT77_13470 [Crocinitomicaceae bacterium]|nr:hypothetical protein [Crocinitomicaceae bacterium]